MKAISHYTEYSMYEKDIISGHGNKNGPWKKMFLAHSQYIFPWPTYLSSNGHLTSHWHLSECI